MEIFLQNVRDLISRAYKLFIGECRSIPRYLLLKPPYGVPTSHSLLIGASIPVVFAAVFVGGGKQCLYLSVSRHC